MSSRRLAPLPYTCQTCHAWTYDPQIARQHICPNPSRHDGSQPSRGQAGQSDSTAPVYSCSQCGDWTYDPQIARAHVCPSLSFPEWSSSVVPTGPSYGTLGDRPYTQASGSRYGGYGKSFTGQAPDSRTVRGTSCNHFFLTGDQHKDSRGRRKCGGCRNAFGGATWMRSPQVDQETFEQMQAAYRATHGSS